jgi:hypothetical protein
MKGASAESDFLDEIAPRAEEAWPDGQDVFLRRITPLLSNVPRDVIDQWIHQHWKDFRRQWAWLAVRAISFTLDRWSSVRIANEVRATEHDHIERLGAQEEGWGNLRDNHCACQFMQRNGTWPRPIIVLHNSRGLMFPGTRQPLHEPTHLLEGHRRLACFLGMWRRSLPLAEDHEIWVAQADPKRAMRHDP